MISRKGRYALRIMIDLGQNKTCGNVSLKDIAERQSISRKYIEMIAKELVKSGLIESISGKGGGYRLVREPENYSVGEILEIMEGSFAPVACLADDAAECPLTIGCHTLPLWKEYYKLSRDFFYSKRLSDLL